MNYFWIILILIVIFILFIFYKGSNTKIDKTENTNKETINDDPEESDIESWEKQHEYYYNKACDECKKDYGFFSSIQNGTKFLKLCKHNK